MSQTTVRASIDSDFDLAVEKAKLAALYNFAYGLSHEINNPLANISARAQTLLVDEKDPDRQRKLATIVQQAFKAHEMIADLMLFARPPALRRQPVDLAKLADTVVGEMQAQARQQQTQLIRTGDAGPFKVSADPTQIAVALKALIQNSLEAVSEGGTIEVQLLPLPRGEGQGEGDETLTGLNRIDAAHPSLSPSLPPSFSPSPPLPPSPAPYSLLTVRDTGPGIPPEIRPHIFDPFFSGREAGRGLGLGLSKAWRIVNLHGGQIQVESPTGHGATFTIALPVS